MKTGYVTVLFQYSYTTEDEAAEMRDEIHMDAEDTYQRYDFVNSFEIHDENMLAERETEDA